MDTSHSEDSGQVRGAMPESHEQEMAQGKRFAFGKNWSHFLRLLDDSRIDHAKTSLQRMLGRDSLNGLRFLDAGSGSGLFSLAARMLGAAVTSFDYDPLSVACTSTLRDRYFPQDKMWRIEQGSVLDRTYLSNLGQFDVVYSWGVLHHTGAMWQALDNVGTLVAEGGYLYIAIYNDQGGASRRWTMVKRYYNKYKLLRPILLVVSAIRLWALSTIRYALLGKTEARGTHSQENRGMSRIRDLVDWVGGYPFEVSSPDRIFDFYHTRGFTLEHLKTRGGIGCNEFVFYRLPQKPGQSENPWPGKTEP